MGELEWVGLSEIAAMLGISYMATQRRVERGTLPAAEERISGNPVWRRATIKAYQDEAKRLGKGETG
jgi:hypothetical protein